MSCPSPLPMIRPPPTSAFLLAALLLAGGAHAQSDSALIALINAYRAAPGECGGARPAAAPALVSNPLLARVRFGPGAFPEYALERTGYHAAQVEVIFTRGAADAAEVMETIRQPYCRALLDGGYRDIGASRQDNEWTIVLARPLLPITLPEQAVVGREILEAVNAARAVARSCGDRSYPAAGPLTWNDALGAAAQTHSRDMAARRHLAHEGSDRSLVGTRATRAGYDWRRIGENIAAGQTSSAEAVEGWIDSPGHCANLMNPAFTEMGAGYGISRAQMPGFVYWTQVLGQRR